jgi:hypothetical protein
MKAVPQSSIHLHLWVEINNSKIQEIAIFVSIDRERFIDLLGDRVDVVKRRR